ncbi:hypothetical protein ACFQL1_24545 [Halomicroarcula sp. GCM10025709]
MIISVLSAVILPAGAVAAPATASSNIDLQHSDSASGGLGGPPYTETIVVHTVGESTFRFGGDTGRRLIVQEATTNRTVAIRPVNSSVAWNIEQVYINAARIHQDMGFDSTPNMSILVKSQPYSVDIGVIANGDLEMFEDTTFSAYRVKLVDSSGKTLATTDAKIHGVQYNFSEDIDSSINSIEYNKSAIAIPKDGRIPPGWTAELVQVTAHNEKYTTKASHSPRSEYFIFNISNSEFERDTYFDVNIYTSSRKSAGNLAVSLYLLKITEDNIVDGPVGSPTESTIPNRYDLDGDGQITITDIQKIIIILNSGKHLDGKPVTVNDVLNMIILYNL